jgi:transposase-like protein
MAKLHLDAALIGIDGMQQRLWRAVDRDGTVNSYGSC